MSRVEQAERFECEGRENTLYVLTAVMWALVAVAVVVLVVNIPFGYWRAGRSKFSLSWFAAIHLPIPLVVAMRLIFHLGWQLPTFLILPGAYFAGQYLGGVLRLRSQGTD